MSKTNTIAVKCLRTGAIVDNGRPVLRGMRIHATPEEAAFYVATGAAELVDSRALSTKGVEFRSRYEAAFSRLPKAGEIQRMGCNVPPRIVRG
jgi:hypothetical protein